MNPETVYATDADQIKTLKEPSETFIKIIELAKEIDPDSARFGELIWLNRASVGLKTHGLRYRISNRDDVSFESVAAWIDSCMGGYFYGVNYARGLEVDDVNKVIDLYVVVERIGVSATVHVYGNPTRVQAMMSEMEVKYKIPRTIKVSTLVNITDQGPVISETELIETKQKLALDCFYPFLDQTIQEIADEYAASDSSELLLIGPPGTGKSTFLRTLIYAMGRSEVSITSSQPALENPSLISWISSQGNDAMVVIEDADKLTAKRGDSGMDNHQMSSILNLTEGIVKTNLKLIISTNLESINKVDPALLRPGRLFKILQFRPLTAEQAAVVRTELKLPDVHLSKDGYTLAEATNLISETDAELRKQTRMSMI